MKKMPTIDVYLSIDGEDVKAVVQIDRYVTVRPNSRADNPDDYYGYTECDFTVISLTTEEGLCLEHSLITDKHNKEIELAIDEFYGDPTIGFDDYEPDYEE